MQTQTRQTRQRAVILEELRKSRQHPTAEEVYACVRERLPRISLGTVYRNLDFLAERGLIRRLGNNGGSRRFDGDLTPHQHVLCLHCGKVGDIMAEAAPLPLDDLSASGFARITGAQTVYEGICENCSKDLEACGKLGEAASSN